ncbi:MAG: hypothetical protein II393_00435 [Cytophagales bacterium]|nr:hypothetical protein [Cytophagales bacterium]MBQ2349736.1 hypothetical protein [Cytophagales bacterium]MBQ5919243.1 hypothetical protein [Lachnospiraceae bacterium]
MDQEQINSEQLTEEQLQASVIEETDMPETGSFYSSLQVASILLKLLRQVELNKAERALYDILQYQRYEEIQQSDKVVGIRIIS